MFQPSSHIFKHVFWKESHSYKKHKLHDLILNKSFSVSSLHLLRTLLQIHHVWFHFTVIIIYFADVTEDILIWVFFFSNIEACKISHFPNLIDIFYIKSKQVIFQISSLDLPSKFKESVRYSSTTRKYL